MRDSPRQSVEPIERSHEQARQTYDRLAGWYDLVATPFEAPHRRRMVELLDVRRGESILEMGFGTGDVLYELAGRVGARGRVAGVDISPRMVEVATRKLEHAGFYNRTDLRVGDACEMPFDDDSFDAICSSFTLELFEVDEIPTVLGECRRLLREDGRLAVASMSSHVTTPMARLYQLARRLFPAALDCRPIPVERFLEDGGFSVRRSEHARMAGIPVAVVVASPAAAETAV